MLQSVTAATACIRFSKQNHLFFMTENLSVLYLRGFLQEILKICTNFFKFS